MVPSGTVAPKEDDPAIDRYDVYKKFFDRQYMHYTNQPYDTYRLSKKDIAALESEK